jgi:DNA-binding PucR family transcriptional regulator
LPDSEIRSLYEDTIKVLVEYDAKNNTKLTTTFIELVKCKFSSAKTADRLFIHRNTLLYRIEQIKEVIEFDLEDVNQMTIYYLGICAKELLHL